MLRTYLPLWRTTVTKLTRLIHETTKILMYNKKQIFPRNKNMCTCTSRPLPQVWFTDLQEEATVKATKIFERT
jgi:hypothetical protein